MSDLLPDRRDLANMLDLSFDTAEYLYRQGRVSLVNWRLYKTLWTWGAARLSGPANDRQHAYTKACGAYATARKIERTRALIDRIKRVHGEGKTPWPVHVTPAPTTARTVAYGHGGQVQIFAEFADARPSVRAFAALLCRENGKPGRPVMVCIDNNHDFYVGG